MSDRIQAIVFDFDGLILDTEDALHRSWQAIFAEHDRTLTTDDWISVLGIPGHKSDLVGRLERETGKTFDRDDLMAKRREHALRLIAELSVLPGVVDWLDAADRLGFPCAVASGSDRPWVTGHLERLGLLSRFRLLVTAEDTDQHKPNPDPFLEAAKQLGVGPEACIALEDSPNGVAAAAAAGMFTIAVPTPMTDSQPMREADLRLSSLAAGPLEKVLDLCR